MIVANLQTLDWANKSYFVENSINLTKLKSDQENKNSFSLEFTEGEVYDLDDIIIAKKRDNADSPLILKVNTAAANDVAVIKAINNISPKTIHRIQIIAGEEIEISTSTDSIMKLSR